MSASSAARTAPIFQVTDETRLVSNIYCERPFCAADSSRFLYARQCNDAGSHDRSDWEYLLCEFETWRTTPVSRGQLGVSISYDNCFYHQRENEQGERDIIAIDLATGQTRVVWRAPRDMPRLGGNLTVSPDGQRLAVHVTLSYSPQMFGVAVVDLPSGKHEIICEHRDLCNAHLQFCPTDSRVLLAQVNRGCVYAPDGKAIRRTGDIGATLWLVDAVTGEIDPLEVGMPHTPPITGHQTWLGDSDTAVLSVLGREGFGAQPGRGNIITVKRGQPHRQLGTGVVLNHLGSTPDGKYVYGDCIEHDRIVVASAATGAVSLIHEDLSQPDESPFGQHSHPHAYLTPDHRWMVFNSDRTGRPQIYVAKISASDLP